MYCRAFAPVATVLCYCGCLRQKSSCSCRRYFRCLTIGCSNSSNAPPAATYLVGCLKCMRASRCQDFEPPEVEGILHRSGGPAESKLAADVRGLGVISRLLQQEAHLPHRQEARTPNTKVPLPLLVHYVIIQCLRPRNADRRTQPHLHVICKYRYVHTNWKACMHTYKIHDIYEVHICTAAVATRGVS